MLSVSIIQRARGVYLASASEDEYGTEAWDAFATVAEAKRWGWDYLGRRVRYEEVRKPGHWPRWRAEVRG